MNYADIILFTLLIIGAAVGFWRGLIKELSGLIGIIGGFVLATECTGILADELSSHLDWSPRVLSVSAFIMLFLGVIIAVKIIAMLIRKFVHLASLGIIDKILGTVFGLLKYLALTALFVFTIESFDRRYPFIEKSMKTESLLYMPLCNSVAYIYPGYEKLLSGESVDNSLDTR